MRTEITSLETYALVGHLYLRGLELLSAAEICEASCGELSTHVLWRMRRQGFERHATQEFGKRLNLGGVAIDQHILQVLLADESDIPLFKAPLVLPDDVMPVVLLRSMLAAAEWDHRVEVEPEIASRKRSYHCPDTDTADLLRAYQALLVVSGNSAAHDVHRSVDSLERFFSMTTEPFEMNRLYRANLPHGDRYSIRF